VRFSVSLPTRAIDAIAWGLSPADARLDLATPVDLAFRLERDEYRGASSLQLRVHSVRACHASGAAAR
jgi:single-stranded-DNA-specific exonuclease